MRPKEIRHKNLELLVAEIGSIAEVARRSNTSEKYLWQIINKVVGQRAVNPRSIGDELAVKLETGCGKPVGWMDQDHSADAFTPEEAELLAAYRTLDAHDAERARNFVMEEAKRAYEHQVMLRQLLYQQQAGRCAGCGAALPIEDLQVRHKAPLAEATTSPMNSELACTPCQHTGTRKAADQQTSITDKLLAMPSVGETSDHIDTKTTVKQ